MELKTDYSPSLKEKKRKKKRRQERWDTLFEDLKQRAIYKPHMSEKIIVLLCLRIMSSKGTIKIIYSCIKLLYPFLTKLNHI